tara:strand:+ start:32 stop:265 length:234 start_codon:yes stop_codon:yes gene_type:complete
MAKFKSKSQKALEDDIYEFFRGQEYAMDNPKSCLAAISNVLIEVADSIGLQKEAFLILFEENWDNYAEEPEDNETIH